MEPSVEIDNDESDLVTVSMQWDPMKANLLRTLLESHGIFVHLWGEHLATMHLFLSNATGGTRLQVRSDQVSQAKELIGAFERGELEVRELSDAGAAALTTHSNPYTPPANPYVPSPATIAAHSTDWPSVRPPENRFEAGSKPPAVPRADRDKAPRAPASPLRKVGLVIAGSAVVVALWLMFTR